MSETIADAAAESIKATRADANAKRATVYNDILDELRAKVAELSVASTTDDRLWLGASFELVRLSAQLYGRSCAVTASDESVLVIERAIERARRSATVVDTA
jgi:hypothetical protein